MSVLSPRDSLLGLGGGMGGRSRQGWWIHTGVDPRGKGLCSPREGEGWLAEAAG